MMETRQKFGRLYEWLGEKCKGEDPCEFSRFKWLSLLYGYHLCTGETIEYGLVPQFKEYVRERRCIDALIKRPPVIDRHSPVSNGHVYCPNEACEFPVVSEEGGLYCTGCLAHVGDEDVADWGQNSVSILVKEDGTVRRVTI